MQTLSARFASMVAGNDLVLDNTVSLTVPDAPQYSDCTVACESLSIDRQMTTDAPASTRMVSGYPAASATVVLSGLFNRYRTRTNLWTNPSFEVSNANWGIRAGAGGGTIVRSLTRAWIGAASGLYSSGATSVFNSGPQLDLTGLTVGNVYTVSGYVWVPTGTPAVKAFLIGGAVGVSTAVNNAWVRCSITFAATATSHSVVFGIVPTAAGQQFWVDAVLAEEAGGALTYFDGGAASSDGYSAAWTGTPGLSSSTELALADRGAGISALDLYNPYNPASPVYRDLLLDASVAIGAGLWAGDAAAEVARMFTGFVDSYDVDPLSGSVTFNCIDGRNLLRSVPSFFTTICDPMPVTQVVGGLLLSKLTSPGLSNVYMLDSVLRANGFYCSPATRACAQFYASMAGGGFPQVYNAGSLPTYSDRFPSDPGSPTRQGRDLGGGLVQLAVQEGGYWAGQVPRSHYTYAACFPSSGNVADAIKVQTASGYYWEAMVHARPPWQNGWLDSGGSEVQPLVRNEVRINTGTLDNTSWHMGFQFAGPVGGVLRDPQDKWSFTTDAGVAHPLTIAPGWHQYAVQVNFVNTTTARYRVYVDGVQVLDFNEAITSYLGVLGKGVTSTIDQASVPCEGIALTNETAAVPTAYTTFQPGAYLDASLNHIFAAPDVSAQDAWTVIQSLASSEYGLAGFDELGVFRFVNRYTLRNQATVRTVDSDSSLTALAMSAQSASAINRVRVPINSVSIGQYQALWTGFSDDNTTTAMFTPAKSPTYGGVVDLGQPFTGVSTYVYNGLFPPPVVTSAGPLLVGPLTGQDGSGYRACRTLDGSGAAVTSGVAWTAYQYNATSLSVAVKNNNAFPVYFVTPTGHGYAAGDVGKPLMLVGGCPVIFGATAGSTGTSTPSAEPSSSGAVSGLTPPSNAAVQLPDANAQWVVDGAAENAIQVPANEWVQDPIDAQALAEDLLADLVYPRPVLTNVGIVADPRLQLTDRLHLLDPDASGMDDDAITFGISTTISATDWAQALNLRAVGQPGYWVLGQSGHSELALTTWM